VLHILLKIKTVRVAHGKLFSTQYITISCKEQFAHFQGALAAQ